MLAYKYDKITKEYLGTQKAYPDPFTGQYALPAYCTFIEPPEYISNQIPVLENEKWVIKTDNRGKWQVKLSDVTFSILDYIGEVKVGYQVISDEVYEDYQKSPDKYKVVDGVFTDISDTEEYKEKKRREEQERINNLTMTALDFIGVLESFGLTLIQIRAYLDTNIELDTQLKYCQNVYCGVAKSIMPITYEGITITAEMVEQAFKIKNGEI